ncbi:MAG: DUF1415 domain-containing protein [Gammaproteobacteria bacterium]
MGKNDRIIQRVAHWIEYAVIGLDLCPFAEPAFNRQKINVVISETRDTDALMFELYREIVRLEDNPGIETTLLIIPLQLADFGDYNDSLDQVDALLEANAWTGKFQVASFHPHYRFEGTQSDDRENWSNRSPYPIYHILRESSIALAVERHPAVDQIPVKNIRTLKSLDQESFEKIFIAERDEKS